MAHTFGSVLTSEKILYYAQMFQHNTSTLIDISLPGTYVVVEGMTDILGEGAFSFDGNKRLTCTYNALAEYLVSFSVSISSATGNTNAEFGIGKNGVIQLHTTSHARVISPFDITSLSGSGIISFASGDYAELLVNNPLNANDIVIDHASLMIAMLGRN